MVPLLLALSLGLSQAPSTAPPSEVIAEVRVHGNHTTPDVDVLAIAGAQIGEPFTDERRQTIQAALESSGRFAGVEVRKRFQSIDDPTRIVLVIVVDERAGVGEDIPMPGPMRRLRAAGMWLPVLRYEDGYGFTYGARLSLADTLGPRSRLSVPLTWGGERQAALEVERQFDRGPFTRLAGGVGIRRRENPHFEIGDTRQFAEARGERAFTGWVRAAIAASVESVSFGERDERQWSGGAEVTVDTRIDPAFPRNAIYAQAGWRALDTDSRTIGRWSSAFDGYLGLPFASVLALRAQARGASAPLPPWEQPLLGGLGTLRGYRAGYRIGDNLAAASAELRVPITSPLSFGRLGIRTFIDSGTTWADGEPVDRTRWDRGIGTGVFLNATIFNASVDVAWPESGSPRWHVGVGVRF